jgi:hypothetical protein
MRSLAGCAGRRRQAYRIREEACRIGMVKSSGLCYVRGKSTRSPPERRPPESPLYDHADRKDAQHCHHRPR